MEVEKGIPLVLVLGAAIEVDEVGEVGGGSSKISKDGDGGPMELA